MPRRTLYDPLQPLKRAVWLVVRDRHRQALEWQAIAAGVDLRAALNAARAQRIGAGWMCTEIGRATGFFFAERNKQRLAIGVEPYDPLGPGPPLHGERVIDS